MDTTTIENVMVCELFESIGTARLNMIEEVEEAMGEKHGSIGEELVSRSDMVGLLSTSSIIAAFLSDREAELLVMLQHVLNRMEEDTSSARQQFVRDARKYLDQERERLPHTRLSLLLSRLVPPQDMDDYLMVVSIKDAVETIWRPRVKEIMETKGITIDHVISMLRSDSLSSKYERFTKYLTLYAL